MNNYLLAISIGPVQGFIAAARRTRDLWFGSELLSEIAKAVALSLQSPNAKLIFPSPQSDEDLQPGSAFNVGNKLMVVVESANAEQVKNIAAKAKLAANQCWINLAEKSLKEIQTKPVKFNVRKEVWKNQVDDVLEFFAAWTLMTDDYASARKRLERLLAARKNSRDFIPSEVPEKMAWGLPKSSLDGQRETVLPNTLKRWQKRKMGLSEGEQLDCPGLVKRLGGEKVASRFTPLSRIAIDPWLRGLENKKSNLKEVSQCLDALVPDGLVTKVKGNNECYSALPYDGQLLYPSRIEAERKRLEREQEDDKTLTQTEEIEKRLKHLEKAINSAGLYSKNREPLPYLAIIAADGDRMGELLNKAANIDAHRKISEKLTHFATSVANITRNHHGHCIYAGGDDVLALLPLDRVISCAKALRDKFCETLKSFGEDAPTLSVGIAVGHFLDPMGRLLDLARQAEKLAKSNDLPKNEQKDALAILLNPRSGAPIEYRARWPEQPDITLHTWICAHLDDLIPDGAAFELRDEARALQWAQAQNKHHPLIVKEVKRILKRKKAAHGKEALSEKMINQLCEHASKVGMEALAQELILTRRFADAYQQSASRPDCKTTTEEV